MAAAAFTGVNVTIANNFCHLVASGTAAGSRIVNATNGTLKLLNSLLAYGGTAVNASGPITDLGDNISDDGSAGFASGTSFNFTDPLLDPLADNGGPTLTLALLDDSPAIDYADSTDGAPPDDQRGYARPTGAGVISPGAYQYGATQIYIPPPALSLNIGRTGTDIVVFFTANPAITSTVHLQSSTNLTVWTDLATYAASASPTNISQKVNHLGKARQFFRLSW